MSETFKYFTGRPSVLGLSPTSPFGRPRARQRRPADFIHARELQGRRAIPTGRFPGRDCRSMGTTSREHRSYPGEVSQSVRSTGDSTKLFLTRDRPPTVTCRNEDGLRPDATPEFAPHVEREELPGPDVNTEDGAGILPGERDHHVSSHGYVQDGAGERPHGVVDDNLRVRVRKARAADASIMPTMPSANTNAATIMIGEKCADFIRGHSWHRPIYPEARATLRWIIRLHYHRCRFGRLRLGKSPERRRRQDRPIVGSGRRRP